MFILHLALGGCLKAPPVAFGITADTGGHIAYVIDAALAQGRCADVQRVSVVTRLFEDAALSASHGEMSERLTDTVTIDRVATANRRYLEKEELAADLDSFTASFCDHIARLERRPDVIHAHFADAAAVALAARRRFGIPFVYTPHALGIDKRMQGIVSMGLDARVAAERAAIAEADGIIVSTRDEAERQLSAYGVAITGRVHTLAPGVPDRPGAAGAETLVDRLGAWLDDPAKPIILAIARPVAKKNLAGLLRAYAGDAALRARANLVVLAGQQDRPCSQEERCVLDEIGRLAGMPALKGRVALPIAHDAGDVTALYDRTARGGAFVNPAFHEPFGLTLIEAAAAGVPVVATMNGGPREIVETIGHGLLVDPRDDRAIADACRTILDDAVLHARLAAAGIANVTVYDWSRYAAASVAVYAALAAARPALLACDIDNTLTGCPAGASAFAAWRGGASMRFVVATGRSLAAADTVLRQWNLPHPDAFIVDVGTRLMVAGDDGRWRECTDYAAALDAGWDRAAVVRTLAPLRLTPQPDETAGPHKLSFFGSVADVARIRAALAAEGLAARVIFSHDRLIDVIAPMGGKAAAIAAYAGRYGIPLAACVAAGDSGNDVDMLEACGQAIVVGNASSELAGLSPRPGLYRARGRHAAGVLEGLSRLGLMAYRGSVAAAVSEAA